jgi:hypothetical protein
VQRKDWGFIKYRRLGMGKESKTYDGGGEGGDAGGGVDEMMEERGGGGGGEGRGDKWFPRL